MGFVLPPRVKLALNWLPAVIGVVIIAGESTSTMSANNTSRWLLPLWIRLFGSITDAHWATVHLLIRKAGHITGYGLLSITFFHGWRSTLARKGTYRSPWRLCAMLAVFCTVLVAAADEYHQTFIPGRSGSPVDVAIDLCGAIAAQALVLTLMPLIFSRFHRQAA